MTPTELATLRRQRFGLTQQQLAEKLKTTRVTIARYESGMRRIPAKVELLLKELSRPTALPMAGIVAAGKPIEAVQQHDFIDVPPGMISGKENFALTVTGESMREEGILPGDVVIARSQSVAGNGDIVVALVNGQATIKKYYQRAKTVELRPVNSAMSPINVMPSDDFRIQGVVVGLMRYYRS
jgi:repressor LexA